MKGYAGVSQSRLDKDQATAAWNEKPLEGGHYAMQ
jgi:hypothetical protein